MIKQNDNANEQRSLQDRSFDLLGEMILTKETAELMDSNSKESDENEEMTRFFQQRDSVFLKILTKEMNKAKRRQMLQNLVPKVARIAAVFVLVAFLSGTIAIAVSENLRIQLGKLLIHTTEHYTEVKLGSTEDEIQVPDDWKGQYYLSWLPDEMELVQCIGNEVMYWKDGSKEVSIDFGEFSLDTEVNIDTEDATIKAVEIQGNSGYMMAKGKRIMIFWLSGEKHFLLTTRGFDESTAFLTAEKIHKTQ